MKILVVNVNTTESMTDAIAATARAAAAAGTEIVGITPSIGADSVEGNFESYLAAVAVMDAVVTYRGDFDAVVQAGFGEHGREGLQELLDVPVIDITDAAGHVASLLGQVFCGHHPWAIVSEAELAVHEDKAEVICLGCGGMAGLDAAVGAATGVPVVDGVSAAVKVAESLVSLGLSTSKVRTYAAPRIKNIKGWPLSPS